MELRLYIRILREYRTLFFGSLFAVVALACIWGLTRPDGYSSILGMHIARTAEISSDKEDQYDDFYRLQADERFADSVVRWLASPRIVLEIYEKAGVAASGGSGRSLGKELSARRLSSQFIQVTYGTRRSEDSVAVSRAIAAVLNEKTESLNVGGNKDGGWFLVVVDEPVVEKNHVDWIALLAISFAGGCIVGFFGVLGKHYALAGNARSEPASEGGQRPFGF